MIISTETEINMGPNLPSIPDLNHSRRAMRGRKPPRPKKIQTVTHARVSWKQVIDPTVKPETLKRSRISGENRWIIARACGPQWAGEWEGEVARGQEEAFWVAETFIVLTVVMASRACRCLFLANGML